MTKIKKLSIWSLGCYGALFALISSLISMGANWLINTLATASEAFLNVLSWNIVVTQMVFVALLAFVTWVIIALVYNLLSRWNGGLKVELSEPAKKRR